jgi:hypothetical protein
MFCSYFKKLNKLVVSQSKELILQIQDELVEINLGIEI